MQPLEDASWVESTVGRVQMSIPAGVDPAVIARSIEELRTRATSEGPSSGPPCSAVVEATSTAFGADGGGVMLIDDQQALHYVGATDGRAAAMEAAQEETGEGPCVESLADRPRSCPPTTSWTTAVARAPSPGRAAGRAGDPRRAPAHRAHHGRVAERVPVHGPVPGSGATSMPSRAFGRVVEELLATAMVASAAPHHRRPAHRARWRTG